MQTLGTTPQGNGRDVLINLAPIFTGARTVPPYLWETPFSDVPMLTRFQALRTEVSRLLLKSKYTANWHTIAIGNEVDVYLTLPVARARGGWQRAWTCSWGLRDGDGLPKAAWGAFLRQGEVALP